MIRSFRRGAAPALLILFHAGLATAQTPGAASTAPPATPAPGASPAVEAAATRARAQELYEEAARLTSEGKFEAACLKLEESLKLYDGAGTAFNLARCWQKLGRTASAYTLFEKVVAKTHELGQTEREAAARAKLETLLPKLSRLRIELETPAKGTEVKRNGELVVAGDYGKPIPLDPGRYQLAVSAEGKAPWSTQVDVAEPGSTITVHVPVLSDAPKPAVVPVAAKPAPKPAEKPAPQPEKKAQGGLSPVWGIATASVGVAGIVLGAVKGSEYRSLNEDAEAICPTGVNCTQSEIAEYESLTGDAREARIWAYVGFGVGGAALAGATYLLFFAPRGKASPKSGLSAAPLIARGGGWGATLAGSF